MGNSLAASNNTVTGYRCYQSVSMEVLHWSLLGVVAGLIPCLVVLALMIGRASSFTTRPSERDANSSRTIAMDRAAYHRQQAEILTRIAKTIGNVDSVAALLKLAAEYRTLADEHERSIQQQQKIQPKNSDEK
jgi:hypothetical protein